MLKFSLYDNFQHLLSESIINLKYGEANMFDDKTQTIIYDPSATNGGISWDETTNTFSRERPSFIGLGHELAHAEDYINGTFDYSIWFTYTTHDENRKKAGTKQ